jgi:PilX N-terminal
MRKHEGRRGSALILALIVILVLSIIGIGIAYLTTTEDRISGNDKVVKTGFYSAEAGLRNGERLVETFLSAGGKVDALFTGTTTYTPPGGGWTAYALKTTAGVEIKDVFIQSVPGDPSGRGVYTLYVRNNKEDTAGGPSHDTDKKINIIAVGEYVTVNSSNGIVSRGISKVLEEQLNLVAPGSLVSAQKGANPAGTGSGAF